MGYYVKYLKLMRSAPCWRLQYISYKRSDTAGSRAKKPKREWNIARTRWPALGFHSQMSLLEARSRAKQLNCQLQLRRQEEQLQAIAFAQKTEQLRHDSMLPSEMVAEFEARFVRDRDSQTEHGLRTTTRAQVRWRAAQRMIVAVGVDPSEWFFHTYQIYDFFHSQKWSVKYACAVLKMANLWGFYYSRKLARPFLPVPAPRGYERQRIMAANYEKGASVHRASKPIGPADLDAVKAKINLLNYNWIFLSVWFGLRPKEVDSLRDRSMWRVEVVGAGRRILWVFQTKIIALPPDDRWKPIPILFDEQEEALAIIEFGKFKRPLLKTMRKYFGRGVNLYGGRKGFFDLMLSKNQASENISVWMGHSTLQRTWYSYKSRRRFHLEGF